MWDVEEEIRVHLEDRPWRIVPFFFFSLSLSALSLFAQATRQLLVPGGSKEVHVVMTYTFGPCVAWPNEVIERVISTTRDADMEGS